MTRDQPRGPFLSLPQVGGGVALAPSRKQHDHDERSTTLRAPYELKSVTVTCSRNTVSKCGRSGPFVTERGTSAAASPPTTGGEPLGKGGDPSPMRRQPLRRRRSCRFALPVCYKYVIVPGNNSRAVLAAFRRRPWWGPARKDDEETVLSTKHRRRNHSVTGDRALGGKRGPETYGKGINLWWEMYVSKTVVSSVNLDPNFRQAVNHFEFNSTLVSKKGLYHSLSRYCASERGGRNMIALKDIVPTTFYLTGGAALDNKNDDENDNDSPWTSGTPISGVGEDHRREFLAYCCALDARATIPPTIDASAASASPQSPNATPHTPRDTHGSELERETPLDDDPHGNELERHAPLDDDTHGIQIERPPSPPPQPSRDMDEMAEVENVRPRKESKGQLVRRTLLSGTLFGEGRQGGGAAGVATREEEIGAGGVGVPTWVVKPAANSNCGFGIQVCCSPQDVLAVVDQRGRRTGRNGWVVQRYIERPLLVGGRKFDIRLFVLLVADPSTRSWRRRSLVAGKCPRTGSAIDHRINPDESPGIVTGIDRGAGQGTSLRTGSETLPGHDFNQEAGSEHDGVGNHNTPGSEKMDSSGASASAGKTKAGQAPKGGVGPCPVTAWCHRDAYVRMSSVKYSNDPEKVKDRFVHLTNNAVQRRSPAYGKEEPGNKLTLEDLQVWLDGNESDHKGKAMGWVEGTLRPRMHALVATSVAAAAAAGINKQGRPYAFELLGYDFMVDDDLRVWLIEVNSNPCLEFVCPLLEDIIVTVLDDTLSVALDPVFRPPEKHRKSTATATGGGVGEKTRGKAGGAGGCGFRRVYPTME